MVQLTSSLSCIRNGERDKHLACGVCRCIFRGVESPDIVQVMEDSVGSAVVSALGVGSILVATRSSSERAVPELNHMFLLLLNMKRAHWKYGVYFVFKYNSDDDDSSDGEIRALNMSRLMDNSVEKPVPDEVLLAREQYKWMRVLHHNGGPVCWSSVRTGVCVLDKPIAGIAPYGGLDMILIPRTEISTIAIAPFKKLAEFLSINHATSFSEDKQLTVFSFSGYAQWNRLKLLGEINRNSWGVVDSRAVLPVECHCFRDDIDRSVLWERYHPIALCAGGTPEPDVVPTS